VESSSLTPPLFTPQALPVDGRRVGVVSAEEKRSIRSNQNKDHKKTGKKSTIRRVLKDVSKMVVVVVIKKRVHHHHYHG